MFIMLVKVELLGHYFLLMALLVFCSMMYAQSSHDGGANTVVAATVQSVFGSEKNPPCLRIQDDGRQKYDISVWWQLACLQACLQYWVKPLKYYYLSIYFVAGSLRAPDETKRNSSSQARTSFCIVYNCASPLHAPQHVACAYAHVFMVKMGMKWADAIG